MRLKRIHNIPSVDKLGVDNFLVSDIDGKTKRVPVEVIGGIGKIPIDGAEVTVSGLTYTYDGFSHKPTITSVILDGEELIEGTDYTLIDYGATDAGEYVLKILGISKYGGYKAIPWRINKAVPAINLDGPTKLNHIGDIIELEINTPSLGTITIINEDPSVISTHLEDNLSLKITSLAWGTSNLLIEVAETQNYTSNTKTVEITVQDALFEVFGVCWDYNLTSTSLTRLTIENDPYHYVTANVSSEPQIAIGAEGGESELDFYFPWAGIKRFNYANGVLSDFTSYSAETYVYIPKFWSKIIDDEANHKMYFYVSADNKEGFYEHKGSDKYIARYLCDTNYLSKSGSNPKANISLTAARTAIKNRNNKMHSFDFWNLQALYLLYLIEYANFDIQTTIGYKSGNTVTPNGTTDEMLYHTGKSSTGNTQYRWIEGIWDVLFQYCDGVLFSDKKCYLCDNYNDYSSSITEDYIDTDLYLPTNGYISKLQTNGEIILPKTTGGSSSTYVSDYITSNAGLKSALIGGTYGSQTYAGLFCIYSNYDASYTSNDQSIRICLEK